MLGIADKVDESEAVAETPLKPEEFEFVLGRRQMASVLFVFTIVLMICIAVSYLAGKSMAPKTGPAQVVREPDPPPVVLNQEAAPEPPLFADAKNGSVYIQMGAVDKGVAVIFAEGLRKRGLPSFVAPGPNDKIFRVLIGPLPDPASYMKAKDVVDKIGLATFARRFPN
jgi:cell division septation protein DedD